MYACCATVVVASPYAVFRASDLGWPPTIATAPPASITESALRQTRPRKRPVADAALRVTRQPRWSALVQGELFQLPAQC